MAIFDFVKQAGQTLSEGLEKAAEAASGAMQEATLTALKSKIGESGIEAGDLAMKWVDDETIKIYCVAKSQDDKEKLILMVGNTQGVAKVEDAIKVRDGSGGEAASSRFYTVKSGDTLGAIAGAELGSADRYMEIFELNKHILSNPDAIDVGQTLRLPQS